MPLQLVQSTLPPAESIRDTAQEVVSRPYFELDSSLGPQGPPLFLEIIRWILRPFFWLFDRLEGLPEFLRWLIVILCIVLCVALIAHIIYTLIKAIGGPTANRPLQLDSTSREIDPSEIERDAERVGAQGDYIGAVRLLFRAALRRLEVFEEKKFRPGITNRELVRRYRATPLAESLTRFVNTIELKWYGQLPCEQGDYVTCRNEHGRICDYIRDSKPAHGA
jgi:hypothetical protein